MQCVQKRVHESLFLALVLCVAEGYDALGFPDRALRLLLWYSPWLLTEENVLRACLWFGFSEEESESVLGSFSLLIAYEFRRVGCSLPFKPYYVPELRSDRPLCSHTSLEAAADMAAFDRMLGL